MEDILDRALVLLDGTAPEYCGGMCNHGPMAAEAMLSLGHPDAVIPWIEYYRKRLQRCAAALNPVTIETWIERLADRGYSDWQVFFENILRNADWASVIQTWIPRLAPGMAAAGLHGLIRTGHAIRNLIRRESELRRKELAAGLAYWASHFQRLPGQLTGAGGTLMPAEALRQLGTLPPGTRRRYGLIDRRLQLLYDEEETFSSAIDFWDQSGTPDQELTDLTSTFARVYLTYTGDSATATLLMHGVTGAVAVRTLLPFMDWRDTKPLVQSLWQTLAGIYAVTGANLDPDLKWAEPDTNQDLPRSALETADEHAIKFTEACLREYAISNDPIYLQAAWDAVERFMELRKFSDESRVTGDR